MFWTLFLSLAWPADIHKLPTALATREPDFELPALSPTLTPAPGVVLPLVPEVRQNPDVHCHPATSHQVLDGGEWVTLGKIRSPTNALVADQARTMEELRTISQAVADATPPPPPAPPMPPGEEARLRATAVDALGVVSFGGSMPPVDTACGIEIRWATKATKGRVARGDNLLDVAAAAKGAELVVLTLPPTTPWADLAALVTAVAAQEQWRLRLRLDPKAPALPATTRLDASQLQTQLPSPSVTVNKDGRIVARFDSPHTLVHAQGQILATLVNNQVIAGVPSYRFSGIRIYDALALTLPDWSTPVDHVFAIGKDGVVRDANGSVAGTIVGTPSTLQRNMISLGFGMAFLPDVHIQDARSLAKNEPPAYKKALSVRATIDGTFRGFDEGARWSADGILFGGKLHDLEAFITVDADGVMACSGSPGGPPRAAMSKESEMVLLVESGAGAVEAYGTEIYKVVVDDEPIQNVRHPNVQAFCVAVAALADRASK